MYEDIFESIRQAAKKRSLRERTIQDIFNRFYPAYEAAHELSPVRRKAAYLGKRYELPSPYPCHCPWRLVFDATNVELSQKFCCYMSTCDRLR